MSKKIMKRSLALGALMAFVITGSAFAESYSTETKSWLPAGANSYGYVQIEGEQGASVEDNHSLGSNGVIIENLVGGWRNFATVNKEGALESKFTVTGGKWKTVAGGNFLDTLQDMSVSSTGVTINGDSVFVKEVVGGTVVNGVNASDNANGRSTNIIVVNGNFGVIVDDTNCPEKHILSGDLLKTGANDTSIDSTIDKTNLIINGGEFNAVVYGGSAAVRNYADYKSGEIKAGVVAGNIEITGGTFWEPIVAGGLAWGYETDSIVENATINITGGTFKDGANIFAGGMDGSLMNNITTAVSQVTGKTQININNVVVQNIYGTGGIIRSISNNNKYDWSYEKDTNSDAIVDTNLSLTNVKAQTVDIPLGSIKLRVEDSEGVTSIEELNAGTEDNKVDVTASANGKVNDAVGGSLAEAGKRITIGDNAVVDGNEKLVGVSSFTLEAGEATDTIILKSDGNGGFTKEVIKNEGNTGISDISSVALMAWRAETNDMNKRLGELRNANGEHGVWVRIVRGESEYNSVKNQYNQYQLGYDEKLSVDKSWTVGMALSYTDAESSFSQGSGENTHKGLAIYGSKLNDDGSFIDLIAKYSRLEHDFDLGTAKGDYDTNGYSVSAEYGKRFQQGNGLWIEPQVELTYGQVDSATYMVGGRTVNQDAMESLVGRVGFSLGKDISKGNVYARASYLYDFEGETEARFAKDISGQTFEQDLGGGWWEVGVGANINLSKATYIYADVEKAFGGEVDTNWQWNLGVRYSF